MRRVRHLFDPEARGAEYRARSGPPDELRGRVDLETVEVVAQTLEPIELRAAEDGDGDGTFALQGHAAVFDRRSEDLSGGLPGVRFYERIKRGAFRRALDDDQDVALLWEHDPKLILARSTVTERVGRLELSEDPRGLRTFARAVPTSYAADLEALVRAKVLRHMSFGFTVERDEWRERKLDDGTLEVLRDVLEVRRLMDVSVVTFPAYTQTDVTARAIVHGIELEDADGNVREGALRALAGQIHRRELDATALERSTIAAAFGKIGGIPPWDAQREVRALPPEPDLEGAPAGQAGESETETEPEGEQRSRLAARRRRLSLMTID